jgi:hypothetical protein
MKGFKSNPRHARHCWRLPPLLPALLACCANAASVPTPPDALRSLPLVVGDGGSNIGPSASHLPVLYPTATAPGLSFPAMGHPFQTSNAPRGPSSTDAENRQDTTGPYEMSSRRPGRGDHGAGQPPMPRVRREGEPAAIYPTGPVERPGQTPASFARDGIPADGARRGAEQNWLAGELPPRFSATLWLIGTGMIGLALIARRRSHIDDESQAG